MSDLAGSGAVRHFVALGALEQGLGLLIGRARLVGNIVRTAAVSARSDTGALERLFEDLRGVQKGGIRVIWKESTAAGGADLERLVSRCLDLVEASGDAIKLLEALVGLLALCKVVLGLLKNSSLFEGLVTLLLGGTRGCRLKSQDRKGVVGIGQGARIRMGCLNKVFEVVKSVLSLVEGIVHIAEGRVIVDIHGFDRQCFFKILIAQLCRNTYTGSVVFNKNDLLNIWM